MKKMWVMMVKLAAGPGGVFRPGQMCMVDETTGRDWIAAGYAEEVVIAGAETAAVEASERAVRPKAKPRRRRSKAND